MTEQFLVAALSLYKNAAVARFASCFATRNLIKRWRFCKGSFRNLKPSGLCAGWPNLKRYGGSERET